MRVFHSPSPGHWERVAGPADLRNLLGRLIIEPSPDDAEARERWTIAVGRFVLRGGSVSVTDPVTHRPNG